MARETKYFPLSLESLRAVGGWAADCAERALPSRAMMPRVPAAGAKASQAKRR